MVCLRLLITLLIMVHRKYVYMGLCSFGEGERDFGISASDSFYVKLCQYDLSVLQRYLKLLTV